MEDQAKTFKVIPGHSLGGINLGASLHAALTYIKARPKLFASIEIHHAQTTPSTKPIIVTLPKDGLRLRFDGSEQRLRCIELVDFRRASVAYKSALLGKPEGAEGAGSSGPSFRRVYQAFGATFPGEYVAPRRGSYAGTYILSWPGIAFSFPMQHAAWSPAKDHVSLLGSQAAGASTSMVLFEGKSWSEACAQLFTYASTLPRSLAATSRSGDPFPVDIQLVSLDLHGAITLRRRSPSPDFRLVIKHTTPQDLISELGPPDATYQRDVLTAPSEDLPHRRSDSVSKTSVTKRATSGSTPSSYSSTATDTYETDFDSDTRDGDALERAGRETFWCYFKHGMDILVAPVSFASKTSLRMAADTLNPKLAVTKLVLHGNIPGTYAFNRHRRIRWQLALDSTQLDSEMSFEDMLKPALVKQYRHQMSVADMTRGKVVNRSWGSASDDSAFFLPDSGADLIEGDGSEQWLGNTRLYHYPGFTFEVAENGSVTTLTVT